MELDYVKQYLRIDFEDDDVFIGSLIGVAEEYVLDSTGVAVDYETEKEKILILLLVAHFYENRDVLLRGGVSRVPFTLNTLLTQHAHAKGIK